MQSRSAEFLETVRGTHVKTSLTLSGSHNESPAINLPIAAEYASDKELSASDRHKYTKHIPDDLVSNASSINSISVSLTGAPMFFPADLATAARASTIDGSISDSAVLDAVINSVIKGSTRG